MSAANSRTFVYYVNGLDLCIDESIQVNDTVVIEDICEYTSVCSELTLSCSR
jgi:hypothetical protein